MSSLRRIRASQQNGRLSRGPITPEGRAKSSQNSVQHGLSASTALLAGEDRVRFDQLLASFTTRFTPIDDAEALLVEQMAVSQWKLRRLWSIEAASLDHEIDRMAEDVHRNYNFIDPPTRLALAFNHLADTGRALSTLDRHQSRIQRDYYRAAAELDHLQNGRAVEITEIRQNEPNQKQIRQNEPNTSQEIAPDAEAA